MKNFLEELKRRNVIKAALAYLVIAWILLQVASIVLPIAGSPEWVLKTFTFFLVLGFPIWVVLSWIYEVTPGGIKKTERFEQNTSIVSETNSRLNKVLVVALTIVVVLLLVQQCRDDSKIIENSEISESEIQLHKKSIAVLAFADMSQEKDQEYFSEGISAELTSQLAKIGELKVIDRRSSFSYKNKNTTAIQIGRELDVSHILDGNVRIYDDKVRIDVQLIDVSDGSHIWLETYDRKMDDIFKIQNEIAEEVMHQLKIVLKTNTRNNFNKRPTENLDAYRYYLEALYYINLSGFSNIDKAISLLEQAVKLDPNFALAYAVLARTYILDNVDVDPNPLWEKQAYVAIQQALSLDPDLADAYVARGQWYWTPSNNFNHEKALQDFKKALELNPGLSSAYESLMLVQLHVGLLDKAMETGLKGIEIEPTNMWIRHHLGEVYLFQGNYNEALNMYESVAEQFVPFFRIALVSQVLYHQGKIEEATKLIEQGLLEYPSEPQLNSTYAIILASQGRDVEAKQRMKIAIENQKKLRHIHHLYHNLAGAAALMGEDEVAIEWLTKSAENGLPNYVLFNQDSNLASLRGNPIFDEFMVGLKSKLEHYNSL